MCEHPFVTSQGHLPAQYARACAQGNYLIAAGLAAQMRPLALSEALLLLPLIADNEPAKYDAAAVRWHARWQLEGRGVDLGALGSRSPRWSPFGEAGGRMGCGCCGRSSEELVRRGSLDFGGGWI